MMFGTYKSQKYQKRVARTGMGQTLIEINGKKFDASTGGVVSYAPSRNIDGINKSPTQNLVPVAKPTAPAVIRPTRLVHDITTTKRHKLQKSQTLMRQVVKKPGAAPEKVHHQPQSTHQLSNSSYLAALQSSERLDRALSTPTHPTVSRFDAHSSHRVEPVLKHMPVAIAQTPPVIHTANQSTVQQVYRKPTASSFVDSQLAKAVPSEEKTFKREKLHKRAKKGFVKRKALSVSAGLASIALIAGFIVLQNLPSVSLALASRNAGISMSVPNGIPSNFQMSNEIDYAPGLITVYFKSQNDSRNFAITQQKITEGTQESLEKAIAISTRGEYQTYQTNGLKLMIHGGKADWIDGDMRYSVSGESSLSTEQLASIATSL